MSTIRRRANLIGVGLVLLLAIPSLVTSGASPLPSHRLLASTDPVIGGAGDISCDPSDSNYNGGNGSSTLCRQKYTSNILVNDPVTSVFVLGDNQYYCGSLSAYQQAYDASWGRLKSITKPAAGNHEYLTSGATDCTSSNAGGAGYFTYFGSVAGNPSGGYYSYDVGTWHIIVLNSQCSAAGGCGTTSPQGVWLQNDLNAHTNFCTLAYWHVPLYSSGGRASSVVQPFWQLLYNGNADIVLNGHDHIYERFAPQDASGNADPARGIREFIAGTGGANHTSITTIAANSQVRDATTFGVLELTLHQTGYDWNFVPDLGSGSFTDSGTGSCHGSGSTDTTPPTAPTNLAGTAASATQVNLSWTASTDDVGVTGYQIFRNSLQIGTSSSTSYSDATAQPSTAYSYYVKATDAAGNLSPPSNAVSVTMPADTTPPTAPTNLTATAPSATQVSLTWTSSTDNVGVTGYKIFRNSAQIGTSTTTSYSDTSVSASTTYSYYVTAYDAASNNSAASNTVSITTPAVTLTFTPTNDSYAEQDTPTTNYGTSTEIIDDGSPLKDIYLKFTVSGVNGRVVQSAKLRLNCVAGSTTGGAFHRVADTTWTELTLNWNNKPAPDSTVLASLGKVNTGTTYDVDVTAAITGDGTFTIEADSTDAKAAQYSSKEGATPPQLVLTVVAGGTLTGVVTDSMTGKPIVGASVSYSGGGSAATTDANGAYAFSNVAAGTYTVSVTATGYAGQSASASVTAGSSTTKNFALVANPGSISGQVTDSVTSVAISGASVSTTINGVLATVTTNGTGNYSFASVPEGSYTLTVTATNYTSGSASAAVGPGAAVTKNLVLSPLPGSISGQVTDSVASTGINGASVSTTINGLLTTITTDGTGHYSFASVPEGSYTLTVTATNYTSGSASAAVGPGAAVTKNVALNPNPGSISGQVTDSVASTGISGASVSTTINGVLTIVATNGTGNYSFASVPEGSYTLTVTATNYTSGSASAAVGPGAGVTKNVALSPLPGSISGLVTDGATSAVISGASVSTTINGVLTTVITDGFGRYSFASVPEGSYTLTVTATNYASGSASAAVGPGAAVTRNVALSPNPGSISGQVTDASTNVGIPNPVVNFTVAGTTTTATSGVDGNYSFASVGAGTYTVSYSATGYTTQTASVTVGPGAAVTKNLALSPLPGSIQGKVADAVTGTGVGGAVVSTTINGTVTNATADGSGNYAFASVPEGSYTLTVSAANYSNASATVAVGPGASVSKNVALSPNPGSISGQVTDASTNVGIPYPVVTFTVAGTTTTATSDASGNYSFANVTEGTYMVTATAPGYGSQTAIVSVGPGTASIQNFSLPPPPGSIGGQVTDAVTGTGAGGAVVSTTINGTVTNATTDGSGNYTFSNVPPGTYTLSASAAGYSTATVSGVVVISNTNTTQVISLTPIKGTIQGQVTDSVTDAVISGVSVSTTIDGTPISTTTNAAGTYSFANVTEGSYTLTVTATNYASGSASAAVGPGAAVTKNVALSPLPASIGGQVTDAGTNVGIPNPVVSFTAAGTTTTATSDASGNYSFAGVTEGTYTVSYSATGYATQTVSVTVGPGAAVTKNLALSPLPGSISGQVTDSVTSVAISGASVSTTINGVLTTVTTNGTGNYSFASVPEGSYTLTVTATNYTSGSASAAVGPGAVVTKNVALSPLPGSISGQVTDSVASTGINGASVSTTINGLLTTITTDGTGHYSFASVPEGSYTLTVTATNYTSGSASAAVGPGAAVTKNVALNPNPGSINGLVTDTSSSPKPIANATVSTTVGGTPTTVTTDVNGNYSLTNVPVGSYTLTAAASGYISQTAIVAVGPGQSRSQSFALALSGSGVIFSDGFESGNFSNWSNEAGLTLESSNVHSGTSASEGNTTNGGTYVEKTLPTGTTNLYYRIYFNLKSNTTNVNLMYDRYSGGSLVHIYVDSSHHLALRNEVTSVNSTSPIVVSLNAWHSVEFHVIVNGTSSSIEVWYDGTHVPAMESTATNLGTSPLTSVRVGENLTARAYDVIFDDVVLSSNRVGP